MGNYDKFFGNPVDVEIGEVKCKMQPLTVAELDLLTKLQGESTKVDAVKEVLIKTLIPTITKEEVARINLEFFPKILEKILKVNGLDKADQIIEKDGKKYRVIEIIEENAPKSS